MATTATTLIRAGAVRDGAAVNARPGAVAVRGGVIVAAGPETGVRQACGGHAGIDRTIDLPDTLVLPAMVNAHAHLDLTDLGPRPYGGDFIAWIEMVMRDRPQTDEAITKAVRRGLRMAREAGVGLLGDIAGSDAAVRARRDAEPDLYIPGASWLECFGFGAQANEAVDDRLAASVSLEVEAVGEFAGETDVDLQPHAPYSAGRGIYERAAYGFPATHLAETPEELQFIRDATGPFADLLRRLGKWDACIQPSGMSPVEFLADLLAKTQWIAAHCNYVTDEDIAILARTETIVAYCPVASDYFGHREHRYRDMLDAGITVCIGADSVVCQPDDAAQPLGVLPQLRHLYRRDRASPQTLLHMATMAGVLALHRWEGDGRLTQGQPGALMGVRFDQDDDTDPLTQVLMNDHPVRCIAPV